MSIFKEQCSYDVIGTATTPATLTAAFSGNRSTVEAKYKPNLQLDVLYTPATTNAYAQILVEGSNDDGTTWFPVSVLVPSSTEIDVHANLGDGMSTAAGIPYDFPASKTTVISRAVSGMIQYTGLVSHFRISAKESVGSGFGTLYVRATVAST